MTYYTHAHYRKTIELIKKVGFNFIDFQELSNGEKVGRSIAMRHDCDNDLVAARAMSEIESEQGVKATYFFMLRSALYNFLSPPNLAIARQIIAAGHYAGLHFDMFGCETKSNDDVCKKILKEREILEEELGVAVPVVSFHQPSSRILQNELMVPILNTYSPIDTGGAFYVSDSNMNFRYGEIDQWILETTCPAIQFLTHPEWWTPECVSLSQKWDRMLNNNKSLMIESLRSREKAYVE